MTVGRASVRIRTATRAREARSKWLATRTRRVIPGRNGNDKAGGKPIEFGILLA